MRNEARHEYWRHNTSGEVFAVKMNKRGTEVLSAVGPLHHSEVRDPADHPYDDAAARADARWLEAYADHFALVERD